MIKNDSSGFKSDMHGFIKGFAYLFTIGVIIFTIYMVLCLFRISSYAFFTYDSYNNIPYNRVGLLLGTSSNTSPGRPNEFFTNRILAASSLYKKNKIDYILVSGDNRHPSYNEPREMTRALIRAGVPAKRIISDYAGFRTIDSIIRAKSVFMLNELTIISQDFHNERALFIAKANGINAIAFNASNPVSEVANFKVEIREFFARIMCVFDIYFLNSQPKFLGEPIAIGDAAMPKQPTDKAKLPTSKLKRPSLSVAGLKQKRIEDMRHLAKQPTDSALMLRQQQEARLRLKHMLETEDKLERQSAPLLPVTEPKKEEVRNSHGDPWD